MGQSAMYVDLVVRWAAPGRGSDAGPTRPRKAGGATRPAVKKRKPKAAAPARAERPASRAARP